MANNIAVESLTVFSSSGLAISELSRSVKALAHEVGDFPELLSSGHSFEQADQSERQQVIYARYLGLELEAALASSPNGQLGDTVPSDDPDRTASAFVRKFDVWEMAGKHVEYFGIRYVAVHYPIFFGQTFQHALAPNFAG